MNGNTLAKGLGIFSLALGATQLFAGRKLGKSIGVGGNQEKLMAGLGLLEIASGIGILASRNPSPWLMSRVAGDVMNLGLLKAAFGGRGNNKKMVGITLASVAAITALDFLAARKINRETPNTNNPKTV